MAGLPSLPRVQRRPHETRSAGVTEDLLESKTDGESGVTLPFSGPHGIPSQSEGFRGSGSRSGPVLRPRPRPVVTRSVSSCYGEETNSGSTHGRNRCVSGPSGSSGRLVTGSLSTSLPLPRPPVAKVRLPVTDSGTGPVPHPLCPPTPRTYPTDTDV